MEQTARGMYMYMYIHTVQLLPGAGLALRRSKSDGYMHFIKAVEAVGSGS